jgi:hypothetical protein
MQGTQPGNFVAESRHDDWVQPGYALAFTPLVRTHEVEGRVLNGSCERQTGEVSLSAGGGQYCRCREVLKVDGR